MQLSVTSWSFPACTLDESWAIAQALGFKALDVGLFYGPALDKAQVLADPDGAAKDLTARGIKAANLYWLFGSGLADRALTDPAARQSNIVDFTSVCTFAQKAGIPSVFVLPGVADGGPKEQAIRESSVSLSAMLPIATDHGVTLTVEPHVGGLLASPTETLQLLDQAPGVKLALDYAHFACMGYRQTEIDPLARHAGHVHLRQARPGALQAKWGEGTLDFAAMIATLRAVSYDGWLAVEYVHQAYMNTLFDDVLTETIRMRDAMHAFGIR
jgi:sugar phosphate isomerase/epimerase